MKPTERDRELTKRLTWLMLVRLILVTVILAVGAIIFQEPGPFYVIVAFYVATIAYILLLKSGMDLNAQGYFQLVVELALLTVVVHLTGGVESAFIGFYIVTILCASILLPAAGGIVIALLASLFFSVLVAAEALGFLAVTSASVVNPYSDPGYVLFLLFFRIAILLLAGFLSSDIAKRLAAAGRELDKLRDLNELILRHISSGLITTNSTGQIIHANRAAEGVLKRTRVEILGASWVSLFGLEGLAPDRMRELVTRAKSPLRTEVDIALRDGSKKPVGLTLSEIRDDGGAVLGLVILFRDLTKIKELEARIRRADRLAAVGELAAGIAHEIRNPMASIRGSIEVLKERGMFNSKAEKLVGVILKESDRLNQIIQSFLDYVRSQPAVFKEVDMDDLLDEIVMLIKHSDRVGDRIRIGRRRAAGHRVVLGDGNQLKQVLFNIMDNAIEAMPGGGEITVGTRVNEEMVEVEIADTGGGIIADEARLFEPFYTTKPRGMGIGLTIADKIVKNHGGRIDVRGRGEGGGRLHRRAPSRALLEGGGAEREGDTRVTPRGSAAGNLDAAGR